jgi:FKBP-type peptidyl-prolyl cis-trans isomerase FkpA
MMSNTRFAQCVAVLVFAGLAIAASAQADVAAKPEAAPPSQEELLQGLAAIGSQVATENHLRDMGWTTAEVDAFISGIHAAIQGNPIPFNGAARQVKTAMTKRLAEIDSRERQAAFADPANLKKYLKNICKRYSLEQSDSGLCYKINPGPSGSRPGPDDSVLFSCTAYASDGTTPIISLTNENARDRISNMLPGFAEGIQMMTVGGEGIFVLPPALSFGSGAWPQGVDAGTPLIFVIKLKQIVVAESAH